MYYYLVQEGFKQWYVTFGDPRSTTRLFSGTYEECYDYVNSVEGVVGAVVI